jgi:pyruvate dehydrogenase E2 component (dihydrolipoamide acetyltransferase)
MNRTLISGPSPSPYATPSVRRMARDLGVDIAKVPGRRAHGRVGAEDVHAYVRDAISRLSRLEGEIEARPVAPSTKVIDFAKFGPIDLQPISRRAQAAGAKLLEAWSTIPHVTNFDEADVTDLEAFRLAVGGVDEFDRLAFLIKALSTSLRKFPEFAASLVGGEIVLKKYMHIGARVETPEGVVTPVIRDVDRKSLREISTEAATLRARARTDALEDWETQGGCITISDLGEHGGAGFSPIINAPEIAILGGGRTQTRPRWNGVAFGPRLILPLCLSWDHRAVDGAAAGRFLADLAATLGDFRRLLL